VAMAENYIVIFAAFGFKSDFQSFTPITYQNAVFDQNIAVIFKGVAVDSLDGYRVIE
jgi:hypothetical protein